MTRRTGTTTFALLTAGAMLFLVLAVGTAPAGNRDPVSSLAAIPGPAEVTRGQAVALTATFENRQKSTFTDVRFVLALPAGATLVSTDCASWQVAGSQFTCRWGHQLPAGKTATVVLVVTTPTSGMSPLALTGTWTIKEGPQGSGAPDTFHTNTVAIALLAPHDPGKVGGFVTTTCTSPAGTPTIATPTIAPLGGPGGPLSTSVCAPNLPTGPVTGIAASIEERARTAAEPGVSQVSEICLPALGATCAGTPFQFSPRATFTFVIDNTSLPQQCGSSTPHGDGGGASCTLRHITTVFHTTSTGAWEHVPKCLGTAPADPCYTGIDFDGTTNATTVTVSSSENGRWNFG